MTVRFTASVDVVDSVPGATSIRKGTLSQSRSVQERVAREIRMLRARRRGLETGLRFTLDGQEGGNSGRSQGKSLRTTAPALDPRILI